MVVIDTRNLYYRTLNRQIRECLARGESEIVLENVLGQRYIGGGLAHEAQIRIHGVPGQDLGAFMNGPSLEVYGNAQDGLANTMNAGRIVVFGKAGEIPGHAMRGGKVFILGDVEYRAGIHMKEYQDQIPWLVVGGSAKDYCGEYMAGGRLVVLNLKNRPGSPVGRCVGTGIHGGVIYVRGPVAPHQLGIGAVVGEMDADDAAFLAQVLDEFAAALGIDLSGMAGAEFTKITRKGHRPFANLYTPGMNIKKDTPKHFNLTPPCTHACPSGIPTPVFLNLIKAGETAAAHRLMDEYTPFRMSICGTVCPGLCMQACNRQILDGALHLDELARQYYPTENPSGPKVQRKEQIAIIGAGPAGLSAAWQLARKGYRVRVYDQAPDLGGKIRQAIPQERLAPANLERDLNRIRSLPIDFVLGTKVDRAIFRGLYEESDAVLVATGAQVSRRLKFPGSEHIESGLDFLAAINQGRAPEVAGQTVLIIGAGNVGMDIACECWRLGARAVTAIDIQKPLAFGRELELATARGTRILWPRSVTRLEGHKGHTAVLSDGTRLEADRVLFSIGEVPDTSFLPESVFIDEKGYLVTDAKSFRSSDAKVYGCGDILRPGLATDAVGAGRLAALEIHARLARQPFVWPKDFPVAPRRMHMVYFGGETREIDRCMSCGTCVFCDRCIDHCPQGALSRNGEIFTVDPAKCTACYTCVEICPRGAIQIEFFAEIAENKVEMDN